MATFIPPLIQEYPNGWGPVDVPEKFKDMPYQPFSKGDRLGKVSLFSSPIGVKCYNSIAQHQNAP